MVVRQRRSARRGARRGSALLAVLVLAGLGVVATPASGADTIGGISGRVTDVTGAPIAGVEVLATPLYGGRAGQATTAEDGTYAVGGLTPGQYEVHVQPPAESRYVAVWWTTVAVGVEPVSGVDPVLRAHGSISGRVTRPDGAGLGDVRVVLRGVLAWGDGYYDEAWTLDDGTYSFTQLKQGDYEVSFHPPAPGWVTPEPRQGIDVQGNDVAGIDAQVEAAGTIVGHVTVPAGASTDAVHVEATETTTHATYTTPGVDVDGDYSIEVPAGTYVVEFTGDRLTAVGGRYWRNAAARSDATLVTIEPSAVVTDIDAVMVPALADTGSISGTVRVPEGISPGSVTVTAASGYFEQFTEVVVSPDATGAYELTDLEPGAWRLSFEAPGLVTKRWSLDPESVDIYTSIKVIAGEEAAGIDISLELAGSISGTVTMPIPDEVLIDVDGPTGIAPITLTGTGTYRIDGLRAGDYTVSFQTSFPNPFQGSDLLDEWWPGVYDRDGAVTIHVEAGVETTGIDATLEIAGSISGRIALPQFTGPDDYRRSVQVTVSDADDPEWLRRGWSETDDSGYVDTDGAYTVTGLRPGTYVVEFWARNLVYDVKYWDDSWTADGATLVTVALGQHVTDIDAALERGGMVTGHVTVPDGFRPDTDVEVQMVHLDGTPARGRQPAAADGSFSLPYSRVGLGYVPPGTYYVRYVGDHGLRTEYWPGVESISEATPIHITPNSVTDLPTVELEAYLTATPTPTVTGTPSIGATLTAAPGEWSPAPVDLAYQWNRDGDPITDGTGATHQVTAADAGHTLSVTVTGSRTGHVPVTLTSSGVHVPGPFTAVPVPSVAGKPVVGATLTAVPGTWLPAPATLSYQWRRDGTPISGATSATYTLTPADDGHRITVAVTGSSTGFIPATTVSAPVPVPRTDADASVRMRTGAPPLLRP